MGLIIPLIIFVGLAAIIVWIADWTSGGRRYAALADLNRRLASGEIGQSEYEEKRKSAGKIIRRRHKRRQKAEEAK
jgi:Short C-terminal domain